MTAKRHPELEFKPGDAVWIIYYGAAFAGIVMSVDRRYTAPYYVCSTALCKSKGRTYERFSGGGLQPPERLHARVPLAPLHPWQNAFDRADL